MYTVDDKTLADGIPIRTRNSIHTQQEKKKKKKKNAETININR
jgi:hypothetical protein